MLPHRLCLSPGAGTLRAKFELSNGPSNPSTLAVQFLNEGTTLSGIDMELQGSGYRLSLNKKRFATGMTADCSSGVSLALTTQPQLRLLCSLLRTIHGRLLRWPTALPLRNKRTTKFRNKRVNYARPSDHSGPSEHRFVRQESHCKKTALSIEHC